MNRPLIASAWLSLIPFGAVTLWCVTTHGFLEPARIDVAHFEAGAGDDLLLLRAGLAVVTFFLLLAAFCVSRTWRSRLASGIPTLLIIPIFIWSCVGVERWAPGYSESTFMAMSDSFYHVHSIKKEEIIAKLGLPLMTGRWDGAPWPADVTGWSYSYMPSCGFGWHKRIFWMQNDHAVGMQSNNEP